MEWSPDGIEQKQGTLTQLHWEPSVSALALFKEQVQNKKESFWNVPLVHSHFGSVWGDSLVLSLEQIQRQTEAEADA